MAQTGIKDCTMAGEQNEQKQNEQPTHPRLGRKVDSDLESPDCYYAKIDEHHAMTHKREYKRMEDKGEKGKNGEKREGEDQEKIFGKKHKTEKTHLSVRHVHVVCEKRHDQDMTSKFIVIAEGPGGAKEIEDTDEVRIKSITETMKSNKEQEEHETPTVTVTHETTVDITVGLPETPVTISTSSMTIAKPSRKTFGPYDYKSINTSHIRSWENPFTTWWTDGSATDLATALPSSSSGENFVASLVGLAGSGTSNTSVPSSIFNIVLLKTNLMAENDDFMSSVIMGTHSKSNSNNKRAVGFSFDMEADAETEMETETETETDNLSENTVTVTVVRDEDLQAMTKDVVMTTSFAIVDEITSAVGLPLAFAPVSDFSTSETTTSTLATDETEAAPAPISPASGSYPSVDAQVVTETVRLPQPITTIVATPPDSMPFTIPGVMLFPSADSVGPETPVMPEMPETPELSEFPETPITVAPPSATTLSHGLTEQAKVGVGIAATLPFVVAAVVAAWLIRRRRQRKAATALARAKNLPHSASWSMTGTRPTISAPHDPKHVGGYGTSDVMAYFHSAMERFTHTNLDTISESTTDDMIGLAITSDEPVVAGNAYTQSSPHSSSLESLELPSSPRFSTPVRGNSPSLLSLGGSLRGDAGGGGSDDRFTSSTGSIAGSVINDNGDDSNNGYYGSSGAEAKTREQEQKEQERDVVEVKTAAAVRAERATLVEVPSFMQLSQLSADVGTSTGLSRSASLENCREPMNAEVLATQPSSLAGDLAVRDDLFVRWLHLAHENDWKSKTKRHSTTL